MPQIQPRRTHPFVRAIKKSFVSGFVIFSFAAYALHERFGGLASSTATLPQILPTQQAPATAAPVASANTQAVPTAPPPPALTASPTPQPNAQPAAPTAQPTLAPAQGQYVDGTYTGPVADAYYGNVQVKAIIQSGKIADVQFVEYPNDRRTSVRINNIAMPYLIDEAIQAQSANVDTISGATLTSEAFAQSLQSALDSAKAHS